MATDKTDKADFEVELVDDVSRPAKRASTSLQRLQRFTQRFTRGVSSMELGGVFASLSRGAMAAGVAVGALAGGVTAMTVSMVDFGQRSRQAFGLLAKEGEVPEQLFQRSIGLANHLGLSIKDTAKQIQKFRALQFSQDQAESLIKMGADMQALGASGEEVSRIFAQLGQIKAKNKLQGEELITLAESGVSTQVVFAALAKQLGKTEGAIQKMISAGQITGSQALNAIGTAILVKTGTKEFGEAGRMMATSTLSGMAGVLRSRAQSTFLRIADIAAPAVNKTAQKLFDALDGFMSSERGAQLVQQIGDAVSWLARGIERAIPFVKEFAAGFDKGFGESFKVVSAGFKAAFGVLDGKGKSGLAIMRSMGELLGHLAVGLGAATVAIGTLAGGLVVLHTTAQSVYRAFAGVIGGTLGSAIGAVREFWSTLSSTWNAEGMTLGERSYEVGKQIVMGLVRGMKELYFLPGNTMLNMAKSAIDAAKGTLGIQSPSKVFEGIGKNTALGFAQGLSSLPSMNVIHSTLGNDNGMRMPSMTVDPIAPTPIRGNLSAPVASGASGGRGSPISITNNINISGSTATPEEREQLADDIEQRIFDGVHSYFGNMAFEEAV